MHNVLTIVSPANANILDETIINKLFTKLEKKGASIKDLKWLAKTQACDIFFDDLDIDAARIVTSQVIAGLPIDSAIQKNSHRRKKLLISDMDSTIIQQECIDEIAAQLGLRDKISHITAQSMRGELDFTSSLIQRTALLKGVSERQLHTIYKTKIQLSPGAKTLISTMKKHGSHCILVSGGFTFFAEKIAQDIGFDKSYANILQIKNGKLTGKIIEPILDQNSKLTIFKDSLQQLSIAQSNTIAVGDGANDIPMLEAANSSIAYYAKPLVQKKAKFTINHTDLTSLLFFQGYNLSKGLFTPPETPGNNNG